MRKVFHYSPPEYCAKCGSADILIRTILTEDDDLIVRAVCADCGDSRSLPKIENLEQRHSSTLDHWRSRVLRRDDYKCVVCGSDKCLQAHHIIPVRNGRRDKFNVNNGITLCRKCHDLVHIHELPAE